MRLVHFADTHLGLRRYDRLTPQGMNQREADVALAFSRVIDATIALAPDVVLVAGDVFHVPRPSNQSAVFALAQFNRLRTALPSTLVVVLAGNHDLSPEKSQTCILRSLEVLGVHVVDRKPERLRFPERGLSILCIPEVDTLDVAIAPDASARHNVLAIHGEVRGVIKAQHHVPVLYEPDALAEPDWGYVALGHYHDYQQVAPRAWYSGSPEFTTSDNWHESPRKGLCTFDLTTGEHAFHELPPPRVHVDLPAIQGRGLSPAELNERIAAAIASIDGVAGKVVRLKVLDVERAVRKDLDHAFMRRVSADAVHCHFDIKAPPPLKNAEEAVLAKYPGLADMLRGRLRDHPLADDVDRTQFETVGMEYLKRAEAAEYNRPIREVIAS